MIEKEYGTMEIKTIKSMNGFARAYAHDFRVGNVLSADKDLEHLNRYILKPQVDKNHTMTDILNDRLKKAGYKVGDKSYGRTLRKNTNMGFEVCFGFSEKARTHIDIDEWIKDCVEFAKKEFNIAPDELGDNIVGIVYHGDEKSNNDGLGKESEGRNHGHLHILVQPIDQKGNLSTSSVLGNKFEFAERHTRFYEEVAKKHGLERGERGMSTVHPDRILKYQKDYNRVMWAEREKYKLPSQENEKLEDYEKRVEQHLDELAIEHIKENQEILKENKILSANYEKNEDLEIRNQELSSLITELKKENEMFRKEKNTLDSIDFALKNFPDKKRVEDFTEELNNFIQFGYKRAKIEREKILEF